MSADTLSLRERIAQQLREKEWDAEIVESVTADLLPVVEQAIQQAVDAEAADASVALAEKDAEWYRKLEASDALFWQQLQRTKDFDTRAIGVFDDLLMRLSRQPHEHPCLRASFTPRGECSCYLSRITEFIEGAKHELRETPAPPQEPQDPRFKYILSGDYYMPGHKDDTKETP